MACGVEAATRRIVGATPATYGDAEVPLLSEIVAGVPGPAVYILDRNFNAYGQLWRLQDEHADAEGVVHAFANFKGRIG